MWGIWLVSQALAASQVAMEKTNLGATTAFDYTWRDSDGRRHEISFELATDAIAEDRLAKRYLPVRQAKEAAAEAIRALRFPKVKLTAEVVRGGLQITARGKGDVRAALKEAERVRDLAVAEWAASKGYLVTEDGGLTFDHAQIAADRSGELQAVADALAAQAPDDRAFVDLALSFVQSIPYESRYKKKDDPGYRWPLSVLGANRGDCDSKWVLFLAIVRAHLPEVPLAVVYVPNHALAGVALDKEPGDRTFELDGTRFLYAEPVGPAQLPLGGKVPGKHKAGRGEVHVVPTEGT